MIYDAWGFLGSAPHWLVYLAALFGLMVGGYLIHTLTKRMDKVITTIDALDVMREAFAKHIEKTDKHYSDSDRLASEEHWKHCEVSRCVHLHDCINDIKAIHERFDQFDRRADETRQNTTTSLAGLREGQQQLARDMGKEISDLAKLLINALTENLKRR